MKTKSTTSLGIDCITALVSGQLVSSETKYPDNNNVLLHIKPTTNLSTEIAIVLPRAIRENNNIGFRVSDTKDLNNAISKINRALKQILNKTWEELYVIQIEVACTIDLGIADENTIDSAMNFLSRCMLQVDKTNKESKKANTVRTMPVVKYSTGKRRTDCIYIKDEITKSMETSLCSNRRLKWKAYSKGAFSEFGGNTSIFRLEAVYCAKGINHVLHTKESVTLQDLLKQNVIRSFIQQFKQDYTEIIAPSIRGFLQESEQLIYTTLNKTSAYNALLINKDIIYDMRIYKHALKRYYSDLNKSDGAFRKMFCSITKRMKQEGITISDNVISIFEDISTIAKA